MSEAHEGSVVTRTTLSDQVWSTPMARLSKEYGILTRPL